MKTSLNHDIKCCLSIFVYPVFTAIYDSTTYVCSNTVVPTCTLIHYHNIVYILLCVLYILTHSSYLFAFILFVTMLQDVSFWCSVCSELFQKVTLPVDSIHDSSLLHSFQSVVRPVSWLTGTQHGYSNRILLCRLHAKRS